MAVIDWNDYSRIEVTCDAGAIAIRAQVRALGPTRFEYEVLDLTESTTLPVTKASALAQLTSAHAWQAASGAAAPEVYSRFELENFFGATSIVVASKVNGTIVATGNTELSIEGGPLLASAQALLQSAHAYVVETKGL